jgi:thiopurine S-methyltransferase
MSNDHDMWRERWTAGRIGFHRDEVHDQLIEYAPRWLGDEPRRILVPLCGKSLDLRWLAERGHEVVAVELVEKAVAELHSEQGIEAKVEHEGEHVVYRSPGLTVYCGDFFALDPERVGTVQRAWDRAALVALPPEVRPDYVQKLRSFLDDDPLLLLNTVAYDPSKMPGPPFSVPEEEVRRHYGDAQIEVLRQRDVIDDVHWKELGHEYWIGSTYLITG